MEGKEIPSGYRLIDYEEGEHLYIWYLKRSYKLESNPRYVWQAVDELGKQGMEYPKWVREYLEGTANNLLTKCTRKPTGKRGLVDCLGFNSLSQLYEEPFGDRFRIILKMDDKVRLQGKSISKAAGEVEQELQSEKLGPNGEIVDKKGRKEKEKGYWGASKIKKVFMAYRDSFPEFEIKLPWFYPSKS